MMQFYVGITETNYGHVIVEAESAEDAKAKAEETYHNGNTFWGKTDLSFCEQEIRYDEEVLK